jgi:hypothetical protein
MTIIAYSLYLLLAIGMTIWVAWTLSHNGKIYLIRCFGHDAELATSINHLLVVGFYLVNLGFIAIALSAAGDVETAAELFRFLGWYVGLAVLVLGAMHFFNMGAVTRHGRKVAEWVHEAAPPPELPQAPEPFERTLATTKRESILR